MTSNEYAENMTDGPDPDTDPGPELDEEVLDEVDSLLADSAAGGQGDWDLRGDVGGG